MDSDFILQLLEKFASFALMHWAFLAFAVILAITGQVIKSFVLGNRKKEEIKGWRLVYSKSMRVHPILTGAAAGPVLYTLMPESLESGGLIGSVLYFALSGAISSWLYDFLREFSKDIIPTIRNLISRFAPTSANKKEEEKDSTEEP